MSRFVFASLSAALIIAVFSAPAQAKNPKPLEKGKIASAQVCGECHSEIHRMWKDSLHAQAVDDPIFRTAYMEAYMKSRGEARTLCLKCHAPITIVNGDEQLEEEITYEGVTCHFCHSITAADPEADPRAPHRFTLEVGDVIRSPRQTADLEYHDTVHSAIHKKSELCAGCHEYKANGITIMGTYSEWLNGPYAQKGVHCQGCHMPQQQITERGKTKKVYSHYLAGGHSITQLKKAVRVVIKDVHRDDNKLTVTLVVQNAGSGHYVPTGIPTRKLVLTVAATNGRNRTEKKTVTYEKVIFDKEGRELTRDAEIMMGLGTQIVKDNRLAPGEQREERVVFYLEPVGEVFVSAEVEYLYRPQVIDETEMRIEMERAERSFRP